ncbi:MAG TPA: roadblock/LC7 domain-containing protein [Vicinamibacteria bacterium]|nr:roadblock/LC7 domain-containing protein [Vicinamibacteria bacterium]
MAFQALLDRLVDSVNGAQGAVLMDATGEVVFEAGDGAERHRLIGAYQGIALMRLRDADERFDIGGVRHVYSRYRDGQVILRPLKDGYYLVLSLAPGANVGQALFRSAQTRERLDAEL